MERTHWKSSPHGDIMRTIANRNKKVEENGWNFEENNDLKGLASLLNHSLFIIAIIIIILLSIINQRPKLAQLILTSILQIPSLTLLIKHTLSHYTFYNFFYH